MTEADWREILSFSHKELVQADKEKLCESLSWMEADDIELNFTDLKTLFRLAQDILKFKSEQVNNLLGQLETAQRKSGKGKSKSSYMESPTKSSDSVLETIAHQEEVIKANKDILEQLYVDISQLEGRKHKLEGDRNNLDRESESSRDTLSEMDAVAELEDELEMKNKHIRKLLGDIKVLEEENTKLKEKVSVLKDKLTEATGLIENLTEQVFSISNENSRLKEAIGKSEHARADLAIEVDNLRKEIFEKQSSRENIYEEIKSKVQHWKNVAKAKKAEIEALYNENTRLKEGLIHVSQSLPSTPKAVKRNEAEVKKITELQEKLSEAANEILESVKVIDMLKAENKQLKAALEETPDFSISDTKNESDDGKERSLINKLKKKVKSLSVALQGTEEMVAVREKELAEITSQLQSVKSDESVNALLEGLKSKKRKLKLKDEGIKSLVQEVNTLSQMVDELQLENETIRRKFNIPVDEKVSVKGILKTFRETEQNHSHLIKNLRKFENKMVTVELENHNLNKVVTKLRKQLLEMGCSEETVDMISKMADSDDNGMPSDGGGEASTVLGKTNRNTNFEKDKVKREEEMKDLIEENEGLRKGLQEILIFLKENNSTTSGVLALQCPSLEAVVSSLDARHAAGWYAPHMVAIMELKSALGGKDALLTALNEARKETFDVMTKLTKETEKSRDLAQKLYEIELKNKTSSQLTTDDISTKNKIEGFGTWISDKDLDVPDFNDKNNIEDIINKGNLIYEDQLKGGLVYFHNKFKTLFEKMTSIAVQTADHENKWSIQEDKYKAEIENLKAQICQDDDISDLSPGLLCLPSTDFLRRKCSYLEESYKYIRTLNENIKSEYLEIKRDAMVAAAEYETEIQKLILSTTNLTDKLRCSIPLELFWKQNKVLNKLNIKYKKLIQINVDQKTESSELFKRLENDKAEIISSFNQVLQQNELKEDKLKSIMSNIETAIYSKQLEQVCTELNEKKQLIESLQKNMTVLQESQSKLIDETLASSTKEEEILTKEQLERLAEENSILKEQCQHVESQLDIALLQLQDSQQRQMSNDLEVNLLRHQILDLQSVGDSKAIIARLSGEVLVAHLQASESHKKIERLNASLNKEKQLRIETEEMLKARQKIFDVYAFRYEAKFRYMYEVMQSLRQQYQGSLPLVSLENYLNNVEELSRKTHDVNEKLDEIEELQSTLMTKHSIFDQILDISKNKCLEDEDSCQHKLQNIVLKGAHLRELEHCKKKIKTLELSREDILIRCNDIEKTLVLVNQGFEKSLNNNSMDRRNSFMTEDEPKLEIEDVQSDDESGTRGNGTVTLPKPQVLKPNKSSIDMSKLGKNESVDILMGSPVKTAKEPKTPEVINVFVQTLHPKLHSNNKIVQTDKDDEFENMKHFIENLENNIDKKNVELNEAMILARQRTEEILTKNAEKFQLEAKIEILNQSIYQKDRLNENLRSTLDDLREHIDTYKDIQHTDRVRTTEAFHEEKKTLVTALRKFEVDKNSIVSEYTELLKTEREQYASTVKKLQMQIMELQTQLDRNHSETSTIHTETLKEAIHKYSVKISELEDKCFKLQSELDGCKSEVTMYHGEVDRWKDLATERLTKMEQLNNQLEERHSDEVKSYKAENEHWLSQLNDTQREHMELRSRLTEQKAAYVKQLAEKDAHIEQLRSVVHGLKTQIMNMQTMLSIMDPSFDLTAIVEVEETNDGMSQPGSERLELKYDSSIDVHDGHDDLRTSSSTIWQESPALERLRREKQLTSKQNAMLRRQIKALAARERRARLDAQNLKNQVFRISTSGSSNKVTTAETAALHNKIASLQAQLMSARRDTHSTVALWDKWKRAQQGAERWQMRFEEKCQEVKKLESSLTLAKSVRARLEKEKRLLLSRLAEMKNEKLLVEEKHDSERSEKSRPLTEDYYCTSEPPVSARALLDRVQAQQRRITALEIAEKGNEHLVSEYEKALAEITSLKGQVLKLESTLLEAQIRSPIKTNHNDHQHTELDYWKSYCEMLKDENVQLNMKVSSLETAPTTAQHQRVNDLEQTVLTLRGLVSKLQAEQRSSGVVRRSDSRPSSGRSGPDKVQNRTQLESYRIEIVNLKRSIQDKDLLLERSKEMLKIAAEREDDLLRENASLRNQLDELTARPKRGFLSA